MRFTAIATAALLVSPAAASAAQGGSAYPRPDGGSQFGASVSAHPKPKPKPRPKPKPKPHPKPPAQAPTPPPSGDTAFPVTGAHSYGDPFGAPRKGYSHQGQDVLAAEGTPVVAPTAGTILTVGYQASAAGYYVAETSVDGRTFFFAHCQRDSTTVAAGAAVHAGQQLCRVGHTGDATGPHLHFEIWVGGWHTGGHPIDPLPQLRAWDH